MVKKQIQDKNAERRWLDEMEAFMHESNSHTWAAGKGRINTPERKDFKECGWESANGIWRIRDSYAGNSRAPGSTVIYFKEHPVWMIGYGGRGQIRGSLAFTVKTSDFLKRAILYHALDKEIPIRGLNGFYEESENGKWTYNFRMVGNGDITSFVAEESIFHNGENVFGQGLVGGYILGKTPEKKILYPWEI